MLLSGVLPCFSEDMKAVDCFIFGFVPHHIRCGSGSLIFCTAVAYSSKGSFCNVMRFLRKNIRSSSLTVLGDLALKFQPKTYVRLQRYVYSGEKPFYSARCLLQKIYLLILKKSNNFQIYYIFFGCTAKVSVRFMTEI